MKLLQSLSLLAVVVFAVASTSTFLSAQGPHVRDFAWSTSDSTEFTFESGIVKTAGPFSGIIAEWTIPGHTEHFNPTQDLHEHDEDDHHTADTGVTDAHALYHAALIWIRTLDTTNTWSDWTPVISEEGHGPDQALELERQQAKIFTSMLNVSDSTAYQYRITLSEQFPELTNLDFTFIDVAPSTTPSVAIATRQVAGLQTSPFVDIVPRSSWGARDDYNYYDRSTSDSIVSGTDNTDAGRTESNDTNDEIATIVRTENGNDLLWPYEYARNINLTVVHHTVSSSDNPRQAIRNIQYYHAVRRGWGDIGYNYIIDQDGIIYEGRKGGEGVIGGHSIPVNRASIGIAVLGNFQIETPPPAVLDALARLIASKSELHDLDPEGRTIYKNTVYPVVSGHRDTDATACPGQHLYESLPTVRYMAAQQLESIRGETPLYEDLEPLREITELAPFSEAEITISLKNNTQDTWIADQSHLALYDTSLLDPGITIKYPQTAKSIVAVPENSRTVAPGRSMNFVLKVSSGLEGGFSNLVLNPVINRKPQKDIPLFVPIYAQAGLFQFELTGDNRTVTLTGAAGTADTLTYKLYNRSNFTWNDSSDTSVFLVNEAGKESVLLNHDPRGLSQGQVWKLTKPLRPGQSVELTLDTLVPFTDGSYKEVFRPQIPGFGFADGQPITISYQRASSRASGARISGRFTSLVRLLTRQATAPQLPTSGIDTKPIRIHLSALKSDSTDIRVQSNYQLYVNGKLERLVRRFDSAQVELADTSTMVQITVNGATYTGNTIRLVPFVADDPNAIFELVDLEQRPAWNQTLNDNLYRGTIEFLALDNSLVAINELALGYYLLGVAETSNGAPAELQKTMNILARTYAAYYLEPDHTKFKNKPYDLDDSPDRSQRYLGYGFEKRSPAAVATFSTTSNRVVTYDGEVVITPYFSRSSGRTLSGKEKWGWDWAPYLQSVPDTYCENASESTAAGHGVGLSGCGAAGMANNGKSYQEIIQYFYQGVEIDSR